MFDFKIKPVISPSTRKFVVEIRKDRLKVLADKILNALYEHTKKQFETQGTASGRPWPSLSQKYARWKEKRFPGKKILERTGALKDKIKYVMIEQRPARMEIEGRVPLSYPITEKIRRVNEEGEEKFINRRVKRKISYSTLKEKGKRQERQFNRVRYGIFHEFGMGKLRRRAWLDEEDQNLLEDIKQIILNSDIFGLK